MKFKLVENLSEYDYKTGYNSNLSATNAIDISKTGMSFYDSIIPGKSDNEYMKTQKNLIGTIQQMSPNMYYQECATKIFNSSVANLKMSRGIGDKSEIDELINICKIQKKRFPLPFLDYANKTQEGLHRMFALGEVYGWNTKFPVLIVNWFDADYQQKIEKDKQHNTILNKIKKASDEALKYQYSNVNEFLEQLKYELYKQFEFYFDDDISEESFTKYYTINLKDKIDVKVFDVLYQININDIPITDNIDSVDDLDDVDWDDLDLTDLDFSDPIKLLKKLDV